MESTSCVMPMITGRKEERKKGIPVGGKRITNLRYADNTTPFAMDEKDIAELINRVKAVSEELVLRSKDQRYANRSVMDVFMSRMP